MIKITLQITENKDNDSCTIKIINPKDLSKTSENEKRTCAMINNIIEKNLKELSSEK